jgi:hypothetical protein
MVARICGSSLCRAIWIAVVRSAIAVNIASTCVSRYVAQGGRSTGFVGTVVRVVIVRQLARAVRVPGLSRGARVVTG